MRFGALFRDGANPLILLRRLIMLGGNKNEDWVGPLLQAATAGELVSAELVCAVQNRRALAMELLRRRSYQVACLRVNPEERLVVGLSAAPPLETGIALHGTYGMPILPGSSLKGLALATSGGPHAAYGSTDSQGEVIFLDAMPIPPARLEREVMTPHVLQYYNDPSTPPAEYWPPTPVPFLAAGRDQHFRVFLLSRDGGSLSAAQQALTDGLVDRGLGAKTAAGYGYCRVVEEAPPGGRR